MAIKYSIIIPTYNRARTLSLTLDSVIRQTISADQYEIIIIDDGSTDNTKEVILNFQKNHPNHNIRYFYQKNGGPAKARNKGIKESKGEIIFFTDDDAIIPPNWMETLLDGFRRHPDIVGVGGCFRLSSEITKGRYFQRYFDFINNYRNPHMFTAETKTNMFMYNLAGDTINMSYKKTILEEIGGFDENLYFPGCVDWEFKKNVQSKGYHLLYVPFAVRHLKIYNLKNFIKKSFNQGRGRYYMTLKYSDLLQSYYYNVSFYNSLRNIIYYILVVRKFFWAYFVESTGLFCGRFYVRYLRSFKSVKKHINSKNFYLEWLTMENRNKKVITTKIKPFDKSRINSATIKNGKFYSLVIPTYNRARTLSLTLDSVIRQTISADQYEIIVIDDGSTDDTELKVKNYELRITKPEIRYFKIEHGGPAKARNKGIKESKGEIIFFTDDDCIVPNNWMEILLDGFRRHPDVVGVGGWLTIARHLQKNNYIERYIHYVHFWNHYFPAIVLFKNEIISNDPAIGLRGVFANNTANLCIKKLVLEKVNGFHEDFFWPGSEDTDLAFRILSSGSKLLYLPFHVSHIKDYDLSGFIKLAFKKGANRFLFLEFNRRQLKEICLGSENYHYFPLSASFLFRRSFKFLSIIDFVSYKIGMIFMEYKRSR